VPQTPAELVAEARENVKTCSCDEAAKWLERHPEGRLIDVREPVEHAADSIAGSVNIPRGVIEFQIGAACDATETPILIFCASGGRSALAAVSLQKLGYSNVTSVTASFGDLSKLLSDR